MAKRIKKLNAMQKAKLRKLIQVNNETSFAVACISKDELGGDDNIKLYQESLRAGRELESFIRKL